MPRNSDTEARLRARIETFVDEISAIVREAAVEAVHDALLAGGEVPIPYRAQRASGSRAAKRKKKAAPAPRKSASGRRIRRSAADLEKLGAKFLAYIKSNPGQRLEEIGVGMGESTLSLKRPVHLLSEAGMLRTEGQRRGTRYFAGKGGARKTASKKRGTRKAKKAPARRKAKKATRKGGARKRKKAA